MKKRTFTDAMQEAKGKVEDMRRDPRIVAHLREMESEGYTKEQQTAHLYRLALLSLASNRVATTNQ